MIGCRALTDSEIEGMKRTLLDARDRALFVLGLKTGFRVSELLSLKVRDVMRYGAVLDAVSVERKHMKRKISGRTVRLNNDAKSAISELIQTDRLEETDYLFKSRKGKNRPITRVQAWRIIKESANALELTGKIGTHSMRKTFASKVYDILGKDLVKTQKALGHKSINSTVSYLSFRQEEIDDAVLAV
jgi:integrase